MATHVTSLPLALFMIAAGWGVARMTGVPTLDAGLMRPPCRAHPHLFQINTRVWLDRLSLAAGRRLGIADVPDAEWERLRGAGFDLVYLMGIWRRSLAGRRLFRTDPQAFVVFDRALPGWTMADVIGSPFSVAAYVPEPRIGTWDDVDVVRERLARLGMRLILDFVPNHVGPDHGWVTQHADCLMRGREADFHADPTAFILVEPEDAPAYFVARGRDPYFAPWADTAQIDHFSEAARDALLGQLRIMAAHCDGLRCDMAMLVLNDVFARTWGRLLQGRPTPAREFWSDAVAALPAEFIWIAEAYWGMEPRLQALGFQYTYDKTLYDSMVAGDAGQIRAQLSDDPGVQGRRARFIENHDETRAMAAMGRGRLPGLTILVATLPGLRFFHDGQFDGKTVHAPMPLSRVADAPVDAELAATCLRILRIGDDRVTHEGAWRLLTTGDAGDGSAGNLVAYCWRLDDAVRVVVVNVRDGAAQGWIGIADELESVTVYDFRDLLDDRLYVRTREGLVRQGLFVRLEAYRAHVFAVTASLTG